MSPTSILLIDDHPIFLEGLRRVLASQESLKVVGETATIADAVEQVRRQRPDVTLLDLGLKDGNGLDALPHLLAGCPTTRVIVLSGYGPENVLPALRRGARGFVSKDTASTQLLKAIQAVLRGEIWAERQVTGQLVGELLQREQQQQVEESLTPREREVLRLVGEGKRNGEIARELFISENTVKTHISSLLQKLEMADRLQLAVYAARAGVGGREDTAAMQISRLGQWAAGVVRRLEPEPAAAPLGAGSSDPLFWRNVRTIARVRVLLALGTALVVFLDPRLPPGGHWLRAAVADGSLLLILLYALWAWRQETSVAPPAYLPRLTTWLDVLFSAALIGSTGAHQSPFYLWIIFTIVGATLKSGWQTAVRVCLAEIVLYLYVSLYLPDLGHSEFVLLGFLARTLFLFVIALVMAHMGQRLLEQNRMLASLHHTAAHMSAGHSTADILGRAADSLTDLLEAERIAVTVGNAGSDAARPVLINMNCDQGERLLRLALDCVAAAPPTTGPLTLLSNAPHQDARFAAAPDALAGVRSLLITRLATGHEAVGVLVACNRLGNRVFTAADRELAELLAAQAGPLLETARLQEQRRSHASGDERRRIAAALHDGLIQTLAATDLRMLGCHDLWRDRQWEPLGQELKTLKGLVEEALAEARGAINELAPVRLREEGLTAHLEGCIRQFQERAALPVAASLDLAETQSAAEPVPEPTALLLIGLLREGLNNVRKHARASQVTLRIAQHGDAIFLRLADDGAGFRPEECRALTTARHFGLASLRERLAASGGELQVTSRPGEGTVLEARVPLLTEERLASLLSRSDP